MYQVQALDTTPERAPQTGCREGRTRV